MRSVAKKELRNTLLVLTRDFEKINGSTVFNGKRKTVAANFVTAQPSWVRGDKSPAQHMEALWASPLQRTFTN